MPAKVTGPAGVETEGSWELLLDGTETAFHEEGVFAAKTPSAKYRKNDVPFELVTTTGNTEYSPLFTDFRTSATEGDGKNWLLKNDIDSIAESAAQARASSPHCTAAPRRPWRAPAQTPRSASAAAPRPGS